MKVLTTGFLLLISTSLWAQQGRADKMVAIASSYYSHQDYNNAIEFYKRAMNFGKINSEDYEKLAFSLYQVHDLVNAEKILERFNSKKESNPEDKLYFGRVLQQEGKYNDAIKYINQYIKATSDSSVKYLIIQCDSAKNWKKRINNKIEIKNFVAVNTDHSEILPFYDGEKFIFTTSNEKVIIRKKTDEFGEPYYKLFETEFDKEKSEWKSPSFLTLKLNWKKHVSSYSVADSVTEIYFCHTFVPDNASESHQYPQRIYGAKVEKGTIKQPELIIQIDSLYNAVHPSISSDGKKLYFASDMKGGFGGLDLYYIEKQDDLSWSLPVNLGNTINSPGNDAYPMVKGNELFFSSNYHPGFGGMDIFKSTFENSNWSIPENMMQPINSSHDDISYFKYDENKYYFSSNRPGGKGKDDIYEVMTK